MGAFVVISYVNKEAEYVDLLNKGNQAQNINGWVLLSEKGNQSCILAGVIEAGASLRVWAGYSDGDGYSCGYDSNIWNNSESDPAVLFDASGAVVDRHP